MKSIRNTFIIFIVSGFWHGANWTFIVWGTLNAIYFLPLLLTNRNRKNLDIVAQDRKLPSLREFGGIVITFSLTVFAWIFFRAESIGHAIEIFLKIFSRTLFTIPVEEIKYLSNGYHIIYVVIIIASFVAVEWLQRDKDHPLLFSPEKRILSSPIVRWLLYYFIIFMLFYFPGGQVTFIYFQF